MPATSEVIFTATHTDAKPPLYNGNGVWTLYSPLSPDTAVANASITLNFHIDVTVPTGYSFMILPYGNDDLAGAPHVYFSGTGYGDTTQSLYINMINFTGSSQTPTAETEVAYLVVIPDFDYKYTSS